MISSTHITYSVWVSNHGLPSFDDRLSVFDLYPFVGNSLLHPVYHRFSFFFFFFLELAYNLSTRMDA